MFGPALLAAPVVAPGQRRQTIYAPSGRWLDFWRAVRFKRRSGGLGLRRARPLRGQRKHTVDAPLAELPMLIRAGSLLALLPPGVDTLAGYGDRPGLVHLSDRADQMRLLAFPRGRSSAPFYERERLTSRERAEGWALRVEGERRRTYRLEASLATLRDPFVPCKLVLDGRRLAGRRWSFDPASRVLRARFGAEDATLEVSRRC